MKPTVSKITRHDGGFKTCVINTFVDWGLSWNDAIRRSGERSIPWSISRACHKYSQGESGDQTEEFVLISFNPDEESRRNGRVWIRDRCLQEVGPLGAFAVEELRKSVLSNMPGLATAVIHATKPCTFATTLKYLVYIGSNCLEVIRIKKLQYGSNDWFLYLKPSPVS